MADNSESQIPSRWTKERWEQVHQLLQFALEREPQQRSAFLREICVGDNALLDEVQSLLSAYERSGGFLESSPFGAASQQFKAGGPQASLVGRCVGPYELNSLLGSGGMGVVYRATDTRLKRTVAIKFLSGDSSLEERRLQYFEREARLASSLNHPNIVTIHDIGRSEYGPYIAMELVEGKTLREILADGPMPLKRVFQVSAQVADGLAKAHAAGIFHRDLKPENLMVAKEGLVKILDFGLAKLTPQSGIGNEPVTRTTLESKTGTIVGTIGYMSPEQASGHPVDFRSDQFSLGTILYEMVTGKMAFERATAVETLSAIIRDEPEPVTIANPKTPLPCLRIIHRCLEKNPEDRYASTWDLACDLRYVRDHPGELSTTLSVAPEVVPRKSRRSLALAALAGLILVAALNVVWLRSFRSTIPVFQPLTFANGHATGARFAQDDESVIYGAGWIGQNRQLYTTHPNNPESRPLGLKNAGIFAVSPSGELAIAYPCQLNWGDCMGTLALVPQGAGEPLEILEDVTSADWKKDGKTLVVAQFSDGRARLIQHPGGEVLYESDGWITDVRVSPDGSRIAFLDHPILGDISGSVCVLESGGRKKVLSEGWKVLEGAAWRPDSEELWFTGSRDGRGLVMALYSVTLAGEERRVFSAPSGVWIDDISTDGKRVLLRRVVPRGTLVGLAPGESKERDLSWFDFSTVADLSADGKTVLFYEWGAGTKGKHTTYLRGSDASDPKRLGEGRPLALSPDGRWALVRQQTLPPQLALLPTGIGQQKTLPRGTINEFADWAAWLDGGRIVFSAAEPGRRMRTYIQDINGGPPEPVTSEGVVGILLSPDRKHIAAVDQYREYYIYPIDGGEARAIDGYIENDVFLQWMSDGTILVRDSNEERLNVYQLDLKAGTRKLWRQLSPPYPAALVGIGADPGEIRFTPDGKSYVYSFWTAVNELYVVEGLP